MYEEIQETDTHSPVYTYIVVRDLKEPLHPKATTIDLVNGFSKLIVTDPDIIHAFDATTMKVIQFRGISKRKHLRKPETFRFHDYYRDASGDWSHGYYDKTEFIEEEGSYYFFSKCSRRMDAKLSRIRAMCDEKLIQEAFKPAQQ